MATVHNGWLRTNSLEKNFCKQMVIFINFPCYIHLIINLLEQYLSSTSQINFWNNQYCSFGIIFEGQHYPLRIKRERNTMCVNNTTLKVCLYMYLYAGFYIHFCKKFPISLVLLLVYLPLTLSVIQGLPALYFECESSLLFILSLPLTLWEWLALYFEFTFNSVRVACSLSWVYL